MSKVKPILYMLGKGGISVLQTAIFSLKSTKAKVSNANYIVSSVKRVWQIHRLNTIPFSHNHDYNNSRQLNQAQSNDNVKKKNQEYMSQCMTGVF